jgi:hypothetical protein
MKRISVGTGPLTEADVIAVARGGAGVELDAGSLSAIAAARDVVERLADDVEPHYGISTGEAAGFTETLGVLLEKHGAKFGSTCHAPNHAQRRGDLRLLPSLVLRRSRRKDS